MDQIIYGIENIIDWSLSPKSIQKLFNSKKNPGLITFFHGHIVLFQEIKFTNNNNSSTTNNKVSFSLDGSSIVIPSHDMIVTKYLIDLRSDHFKPVLIASFVKYFPECKEYEFTTDRTVLSWKEICAFEKRCYDAKTRELLEKDPSGILEYDKNESLQSYETGILKPNTLKERIFDGSEYKSLDVYAYNLYENSKLFCKYLGTRLQNEAKILDLGGGNEPWFSFLCSDNRMTVVAYDMTRPGNLDLIKNKGITYIYDDINNLESYHEILSGLDLIFCRNLSPAQRFWDWYDKDYVKIWKTIANLINEDGVIYWIQMGNGTGKPDTFFMNHDAVYFKKFFSDLGLQVNITKYGYIRFKITKNSSSFAKWNFPEIHDKSISIKEKQVDLYKAGDYSSLIKHYVLQLQSFYEKNNYKLSGKIKITGKPTCARIAELLLLENFHCADVVMAGKSDVTKIEMIANGNIQEFTLTDKGLRQEDYFLIDGPEDKRITEQFSKMLAMYRLYKIQRKFPMIVDIKKKYFRNLRFWS